MSLEKIAKEAADADKRKFDDFQRNNSPGKLYARIYNLSNRIAYSPVVANYIQYLPAILDKIL